MWVLIDVFIKLLAVELIVRKVERAFFQVDWSHLEERTLLCTRIYKRP